MAHETVRAWINTIARNHLSVNHAGSIHSEGIDEAPGVIDIVFQANEGPRGAIIVKKAIIRGVSNTVANRFQRLRLLDSGVSVRAYGMPSRDLAVLPVTIIRDFSGHVDWVDGTDQTDGWVGRAGGAKRFIEERILSESLADHGVHLETDQDPSLEGG